jgi:hypothetical protein
VLPIVDIASNTTQKVQVGNLPTTTAVTNALATKQPTLVSGTNIKTVNSTSLLGSGDVAVQETLVSGTNIKTINSTSLLGSGDIVISANPSGVAGAIQFSDGSAFASDAANLFWDDANNRLGVGTNAPNDRLEVNGNIRVSATSFLYSSVGGGAVTAGLLFSSSTPKVSVYTNSAERVIFGTSTVATIKGSGTTSATTSLLVQNSAGTAALTVRDNLSATFGSTVTAVSYSCIGSNSTLATVYAQINNTFLRASSQGLNISAANIAPDNSAQLQVDSTTKGFLPPRMTTTEKNAIATPAAGLVVYDTTLNKLCVYTTAWETITSL